MGTHFRDPKPPTPVTTLDERLYPLPRSTSYRAVGGIGVRVRGAFGPVLIVILTVSTILLGWWSHMRMSYPPVSEALLPPLRRSPQVPRFGSASRVLPACPRHRLAGCRSPKLEVHPLKRSGRGCYPIQHQVGVGVSGFRSLDFQEPATGIRWVVRSDRLHDMGGSPQR